MPRQKSEEVTSTDEVVVNNDAISDKLTCGLVMPISAMENCDEAHWEEVRAIIREALPPNDFEVKLVSQSEEAGIIHRNIVDNLYSNDVVVCDVSAKNPNVMFELGMRLAFDKPVVVIKDDRTNYSFDTSPVEHITYPRDLRFSKIVSFKKDLHKKVISTHKTYKDSGGESGFLSSFGSFKLPKIVHQEVPAQEYIIEQLSALTTQVERLNRVNSYRPVSAKKSYVCLRDIGFNKKQEVDSLAKDLSMKRGIDEVIVDEMSPGHFHLNFTGERPVSSVRRLIEQYAKNDLDDLLG